MREYPILHLDTNESKETACSKKRYKCNMRDYPILHLDTNINEHERVSNITLRHKCKETACKEEI